MFVFVALDGFGIYKVSCSECGFITEVDRRSFTLKAYEELPCPACRELAEPGLKAKESEEVKDRCRLADLEDRLMGVAYADNRIILK